MSYEQATCTRLGEIIDHRCYLLPLFPIHVSAKWSLFMALRCTRRMVGLFLSLNHNVLRGKGGG